jgi:hypothetical protein
MLRTRKNMSLLETPKFIYGVPLPTAYFPLPFINLTFLRLEENQIRDIKPTSSAFIIIIELQVET